jgi:hypothetical protein
MGPSQTDAPATKLTDVQRRQALERYRQLRPHLEQDVPLARVARDVAMPLRTAQRWVGRYRYWGSVMPKSYQKSGSPVNPCIA